jgi:hypothetical protein
VDAKFHENPCICSKGIGDNRLDACADMILEAYPPFLFKMKKKDT